MKRWFPLLFSFVMVACVPNYVSKNYGGVAWKKQIVPGKIECEWYDKGGESIAYHDSDAVNNGSGKLNPANGSFLNEFRMKEGVDISYTKQGGIDDNSYSKVHPVVDQLYVGWTTPGEWINYSIQVKKTGTYRIALMYTANGDGSIALDIDNDMAAASLKINSTHNNEDTVAWRQWHHWNKTDSLTLIYLKKGLHLLTLHVIEHGNMNFDYLEFIKQ